ncbi:hypothetical protein HDV57DRAFT_524258 [Trichoderma longibrachiatum]|uniref:Uncharacterized protein n=1 Tax=Trichoderma longibrachiatum ATCC 18648 TaxID=983965 RepID=A0A2T4C9D1_TRILO|nr:hypothetical protein M440DRAFT_1429238 [Trichoderma longibrachiatum ATCC 18648]
MEIMEDWDEGSSYASEESDTGELLPDDPQEPTENAHDPMIEQLFPWVDPRSNVITRHVKLALARAYQNDSGSWSWEMNLDFRHTAPTLNFSVYAHTGALTHHVIGKKAKRPGANWVHFWFLRVMFGPRACSRQSWFAELAEKYPWVMDEAPGGVVPWNAKAIIANGREDWVPAALGRECPDTLAVMRTKREAADGTENPRPSKTPRASTPCPQDAASVSAETDVWAELDAADFKDVRVPSKSYELQLNTLKMEHEALKTAHETLREKYEAMEERYKALEKKYREQEDRYRGQEEKLDKLCTRLVQLGNLVKHQNGI